MGATRILLADDDPVLLRGLDLALTGRGYSVRTASSGAHALSLLETEPADVVVLDVMMPGMDGLEVLTNMRRDRRWSRVPVVVITALPDGKVAEAIEGNGPAQVLSKPFRVGELVGRIECVVGRGGEGAGEESAR